MDFCGLHYHPSYSFMHLTFSVICAYSLFKYFIISSFYFKLTLMKRHRFHIAVQVFKVIHRLCPAYLRDWFVYTEVYTRHSGRNKYHLYIPQIHTTVDFSIVEQWLGTVTPHAVWGQNFVTYFLNDYVINLLLLLVTVAICCTCMLLSFVFLLLLL